MITHIKGLDNPADILSRQLLPLNYTNEEISTDFFINSITANSVPRAMTFSEILRASKDDPVLQVVTKCLQENIWSKDSEIKPYFKVKNQLTSKSGIILNGTKIIIPKCLQRQVLEIAHEGHQGMSKMKALLRTKVWWPGIDKDTENLISSCIPCLSNSKDRSPEPSKPTLMQNPWEKVHIDLYGPVPTGESILGITDSSSRWPEIHIIKSTESATTANKLNKTFTTHGFPYEIITNNALNLISVEVTDYCKQYGINHHKATPYWPKENSKIEHFYKTLRKAIRSINAEEKNWRKEISYFIFQYRTTPHCTNKETPAKLLMGRELRGKIPAFTENESKFLEGAKQKDFEQKEKNENLYTMISALTPKYHP